METVSDLTQLSPSQIDTLWAAAMEPAWQLFDQANDQDRKAARYERAGGHYIEQAARYTARATELRAQGRAISDTVNPPFAAEWDARGGWSRAYVVPDGHIHRSTSCHTLYPTTRIAWIPEQSGLSEDEIVAAAGVHACTVCYPTAPVEALRAAEAAAKAALQCPGSGEYAATSRRYATCPHCRKSVSVTPRGSFRAHKPQAA